MKELYVVEALRGGDREAHSYVLGIWDNLEAAKDAARRHVEHRGGKYTCQVNQRFLNDEARPDWCSTVLHEEVAQSIGCDQEDHTSDRGNQGKDCIIPPPMPVDASGFCDSCGSECLLDEMHVIKTENLSGIVLCPNCFRK